MSRDRALRSGGFSAFLAVWFGAISFFTDHGPVVATLQWLCICGLVFEAYRNFAHAAFNTTRGTEGLENSA